MTAALIITACFFTWVSVDQKIFFVGGFHSSINSRFGQPGILHLAFSLVYILFLLLNKMWTIRTAFFISALNIAWAVRNFIVIPACSGGICPQKHTALYVILAGSLLLIVFTSFIGVKSKQEASEELGIEN